MASSMEPLIGARGFSVDSINLFQLKTRVSSGFFIYITNSRTLFKTNHLLKIGGRICFAQCEA